MNDWLIKMTACVVRYYLFMNRNVHQPCIIDEWRLFISPNLTNVMTNCKQVGLVWPLASTWNHEVDHQTHGGGEEDDPDDSLHDVPAVLRDVLEAMQGGLRTVTLPLLSQSWHLRLAEHLNVNVSMLTRFITTLYLIDWSYPGTFGSKCQCHVSRVRWVTPNWSSLARRVLSLSNMNH